MSYVPEKLPCGVIVNQDYHWDKEIECCATVCPDKSYLEIELCYG